MTQDDGCPSERTPLLPPGPGTGRRDSGSDHVQKPATSGAEGAEDLAPEAPPEAALAETDDEDEDAHKDSSKSSTFRNGVSVGRFWCIFICICLQYFMACFDSTLMASSHPVITSYFHSSNSASWLSTAFLLTSTSFQPVLARASDITGRRPVFLLALWLFAAATLGCALAPSIGAFIAARAVAGLAAGGIFSMGAIVINDLVPIEIRGQYQALVNLFFGCGLTAGAALGGFMCDTIGWRWTFGAQMPLQAVVLAVAAACLPNDLGPCLAARSDQPQHWWQHVRSFDLGGSVLLAGTVAAMILALNLGGNVVPWTHPFIPTALAVSVAMGALLLRVERRATRPILPLAMLFTAPRGLLVFSNLLANVSFNSIVFNAPLFFQAVKLESPSLSGFRMAAPSVAVMVMGVASGLIITRTRRLKPLLVTGSAMALVGAGCLTAMWDGIPTWLATAFVVPVSGGLGLSFPATSLAVIAVSAEADQAVMAGTLSLFRSLGSVFGVAVSSLLVQNVLGHELDARVTEPGKDEVIRRVRRSVLAIFDLDPLHQRQVVLAYERSLTWAFAGAVVVYVMVNALVWPIRLPRLGESKRRGRGR